MSEHPGLTYYKASQLLAVKWKKMSEERKLVYQKRLEELERFK